MKTCLPVLTPTSGGGAGATGVCAARGRVSRAKINAPLILMACLLVTYGIAVGTGFLLDLLYKVGCWRQRFRTITLHHTFNGQKQFVVRIYIHLGFNGCWWRCTTAQKQSG